jgi:Glycosyl transferase family 2
MKKYLVRSRITGRGKQVFNNGDVIDEIQIPHDRIKSLLHRGFIVDVEDAQPPITGKIKLAIVTSVWKRPEVLELFQKGIRNLREKCTDFEIILVISGSIQDDKNEHAFNAYMDLNEFSAKQKESFFKYIEIPNEPLAAKVNATTYACRNLGVHYVLCMGSDDIISPELLNEYAKHMRKGIDFIGVTDCYFYDTVSKQSLYWGGYTENYRKGHTTGAFRAISARLMAKWNWMPWENKHSHILDTSMQEKLLDTQHTAVSFSMKEKGMFALDIKSSTNMTPFKKWDNSEFIDTEIIKNQFPYIF